MRLARASGSIILLVLGTTACWPDILPPGSGGNRVAAVTVSPASSTLLVGETQQLVVQVTNDAGEALDRLVRWTSSDPRRASVTGEGLVSALAVTSSPVTISAVSGGVTGTAAIIVGVSPPASLEIQPREVIVAVGSTVQLDALVEDAQGEPVSGTAATWTGSDASVAEVGADGTVRGVAAGVATVYAALGSLRDSAMVEVTLPNTIHVCSAGDGSAPTVPSIAAALEAVNTGGEILLCDGRFTAPDGPIDRAVAIGSLPGATVIVEGELRVEHGEGTVQIRDLVFEDIDPAVYYNAVRASGLGDLLVESSSFHGIGVVFGSQADETGTLTVRDSRFIGRISGVTILGGTGSIVDNYFEGSTGSSTIQWQGGTSGDVLRNRFLDCGWRGCIRVVNAGTVLIADNFIETNERRDVFEGQYGTGVVIGIAADGVDVVAERNTIIGLGTVADAADKARYPMSVGALYAFRSDPGRSTVLRNNVVRGAGTGIGVTGVETLIARDNVIENVHTAIETGGHPGGANQGIRDIRGNDFVSYVVAVELVSETPTGPLPPASLVCNWWGSETGPLGPVTVEPSQYTPFATAPIAGTGRAC